MLQLKEIGAQLWGVSCQLLGVIAVIVEYVFAGDDASSSEDPAFDLVEQEFEVRVEGKLYGDE